ncbi:MAG TPA: hypothetical protein VFG73_03725 [Rhodanobacteraceae bacterium]|nr:hypothetical protein [Rhodanobacteraceae bacterium]
MSPQRRPDSIEARRAAARRTAWIMGGVAAACLLAFVLHIVLR